MYRLLHRDDQVKGAIAAVEFEGAPYGAGISFFIGDLEPGKGPPLHAHPYSEICIVQSGQVAMMLGGEKVTGNELQGEIVTGGKK